jgi:MbtH protein
MDESDDVRTYRVVVNTEGQYSIWLAHKDIPGGWTDVGFSGPKRQCLEHVASVWTDMRPVSLRRRMDGQAP